MAEDSLLQQAQQEIAQLKPRIEALEALKARLEQLEAFVVLYQELAAKKSVQHNALFTSTPKATLPNTLGMRAVLNKVEALLKVHGRIPSTTFILDELAKEGHHIPQKTLSSYLSQTKDRFKFDRDDGGWRLVEHPQPPTSPPSRRDDLDDILDGL